MGSVDVLRGGQARHVALAEVGAASMRSEGVPRSTPRNCITEFTLADVQAGFDAFHGRVTSEPSMRLSTAIMCTTLSAVRERRRSCPCAGAWRARRRPARFGPGAFDIEACVGCRHHGVVMAGRPFVAPAPPVGCSTRRRVLLLGLRHRGFPCQPAPSPDPQHRMRIACTHDRIIRPHPSWAVRRPAGRTSAHPSPWSAR